MQRDWQVWDVPAHYQESQQWLNTNL